MNGVFVIAKKEIRQLTHNTQLMVSSFVMAFVFGAISGPALIATGGPGTGIGIDTLLFTYGLMIGLLIGYILSGQTFLREKQDGTIETLLAGPLPIKEIWLGKVIGVLIPAYLLTLASTGPDDHHSRSTPGGGPHPVRTDNPPLCYRGARIYRVRGWGAWVYPAAARDEGKPDHQHCSDIRPHLPDQFLPGTPRTRVCHFMGRRRGRPRHHNRSSPGSQCHDEVP